MAPRQITTDQYDIDTVRGIDRLRSRMEQAGSDVTAWSHILKDYVKFGNNKVADSVAIFNFNSATDCMNRNTKHCQVPDGMCYAYNDEERYGAPLDYRRRQEYLWDCLDADTFAAALTELIDRKRNPVTAIRFSESGDFRSKADVIKVDRIAELLEGIKVYTYSASDWIDWSDREHFTLNASNDSLRESADRRFFALDADAELPDGAVWCPFDLYDGDDLSERLQCGDCQLCLNPNGPDVAIPIH